MSDKQPDAIFGAWFEDKGDPARNPVALARSAMRAPLPRRFYETVSVAEEDGLFHLRLDGRAAKTPGRKALALPSASAAELVAAEWRAQPEHIDPAEMHASRIANSAIDRVSAAMPAVADEIAAYAEIDLICYRAAEPEALVERQRRDWDPLVAWARDELGIRLALGEGVMHVAQPRDTIERLEMLVRRIGDPVALAAFHVMTTLSGSLVIAEAVRRRHLLPATAFDLSEIEADFTAEVWGEDEEAAFRRARRKTEFEAASGLLLAVESG